MWNMWEKNKSYKVVYSFAKDDYHIPENSKIKFDTFYNSYIYKGRKVSLLFTGEEIDNLLSQGIIEHAN